MTYLDITACCVTLILEVLLLFFSIKSLVKTRRKTLYDFSNVGYLSFAVFLVFVLGITVWSIVESFVSNPYELSSFQHIIGGFADISQRFTICILPFVLVLFLLVSVSNVVLLFREGRSWKNLLGTFLGLFFIFVTLFVPFLWDIIYEKIIFPIYLSGAEYIIIFDLGIPLFISGLICFLECIMLGLIIYGYKAARHIPAYDKDYIIILGCQISKDNKPLPLLRGRIDRAVEFAKNQYEKTGKTLKFVVSGGKGNDEKISEAEAMRIYLLEKGISEDKILVENKSKNTFENMKFSKALIEKENKDAKVVFCTTNYHVFRSGIFAINVGLKPDGIGSKTKWYFWPNAFVREYLAMLYTRKKRFIPTIIIMFLFCLLIGFLCFASHRMM